MRRVHPESLFKYASLNRATQEIKDGKIFRGWF